MRVCWCVTAGFVQFIQKEIVDTNFQQLDSSLRLLMQLVSKYTGAAKVVGLVGMGGGWY